jgi:pyruvate dehydrogenase E1 component beta subunit
MNDPVIFLEHKRLYMTKGNVIEGENLIDFGKGDIKRKGKDITLIAWSGMIQPVLAAAELLANEGIEAEIVDPRTLVPLDVDLILESVRKTEHVIIIQEAVRRGGVASDIASLIQYEAFDYLNAPIEIIAGLNTPIPFNLNLEADSIPKVEDIVTAAKRCLNF